MVQEYTARHVFERTWPIGSSRSGKSYLEVYSSLFDSAEAAATIIFCLIFLASSREVQNR